jgi:hypothetical protein
MAARPAAGVGVVQNTSSKSCRDAMQCMCNQPYRNSIRDTWSLTRAI